MLINLPHNDIGIASLILNFTTQDLDCIIHLNQRLNGHCVYVLTLINATDTLKVIEFVIANLQQVRRLKGLIFRKQYELFLQFSLQTMRNHVLLLRCITAVDLVI